MTITQKRQGPVGRGEAGNARNALSQQEEDRILNRLADEAIREAERDGWIPAEEVEKELGL
jgi:hypothetical protein